MGKMIIDGKEAFFREEYGPTILEVAEKNGIYIPTLCSEEYLGIRGNCRVCMVERADNGKLVAACCTPAENGLSVEPFSSKASACRKSVVELILANHRRNCTGCDKNKHCDLQKVADSLNIVCEEYSEVFRRVPERKNGVLRITRDRCIKCGRCKAYCSNVLHVNAAVCLNRGWDLEYTIDEETCIQCGKCVQFCPVGCLCADTQLEMFWDLLDHQAEDMEVLFFDRDLAHLDAVLQERTGYSMEVLSKFFRKLGIRHVSCHEFSGWPDTVGTPEWTAQKDAGTLESLKRMVEDRTVAGITTDISFKATGAVKALLVPDDVNLLIIQSLYDISAAE